MKLLKKTIASIVPADINYFNEASKRLAQQARPAGSLGLLEDISTKLASIKKSINIKLDNKLIITCAGDHGIVAEGVSLFPQEVTAQMIYNFVNGGASINVIAKHAGADVVVADLGVNHEFPKELNIFHKKINKGTKNFLKEPAMSEKEAVRSIEAGIEIINELAYSKKIDIIGSGDMGIGNTTPSTAIIAAFSELPIEELTGRGTGIDDKALNNKIAVIKKGLEIHRPDKDSPIDILAKIGGFEIGGLAGLVIGAAARGIPIICDGLISTAGALIACKLAPVARDYLFASHKSVETGHSYMLKELGLEPLIDFKLRLGEGTGAGIAMEILDLSTRVLADIKTFEEVAIANVQK